MEQSFILCCEILEEAGGDAGLDGLGVGDQGLEREGYGEGG